ncbi:protein kinase [Streptomyces sp. NPDC059009]|uniref:serine/threonine-protein kinase n=1 Tax=Streptomyces sp. NPDC059009 TaxID=3346694 RepID=UPI0036902295
MEKLGPGDPQRIGAYRLLGRLGAGGMGQVYLARSGRGRTVAVKLVRQELAEQEEFRNRFRQEVQAARRVGGAWTAPVLDADTEAEIPWVATGYVAGPSLQAVVGHDHGPLPERTVTVLAAGLANALKDIHTAGLIHRDLKPSNVLITIDGPRVIDFGIARALETVTDGGLTRTGALVGSPGFMAPEQVRGDRITPACDVFCLGSVLAYAATGALPFGTANSGVHALMFRIAQEEPDLEGVPEELADLVRDCLAKDPAARPSLDALLERTGAADTLAIGGGKTLEPWLPAALVAQLGRHAVQLLDAEDPDEATPAVPGTPATPAGGPTPSAPATPPATPSTPAAPDAPSDGPPAPHTAAPLDHLPTMIGNGAAPHTPPPTPPPGAPTPAYGYPQPPAYGYPQNQAPAHPHPQPHPHTPAPYPYAPASPPPRRSGRSTAALVAVALVVAVGAGGAVYAVMKGDTTKSPRGHGSPKPPTSSAPTTPGPTTSEPGSQSPQSSKPPQDGTVPDDYLGTWNGGLDNDDGHHTRHLTLQQGEVGDTVLSLTADGPTDSGGTYHCVFQGELTGVDKDAGTLSIGPTTVTLGEPASSCKAGKASTITLLSNGGLRRVNDDSREELTYTKG